jgi:hypothetical protein
MIRLPEISPCADCDHFKGVKQPHGNESVEYFYCAKYKRIPAEHINGEPCEHQETEE